MRIPSYLSRNRFGTFYFRIVFPDSVYAIIGRKETRRSLKTYDRSVAISISVEFQQINKHLFTKIVRENMQWREVKKVLDRVSDHLFAKYVEEVDQGGFDFDDRYSLSKILPEANTFIRPQDEYQGHLIHWDQSANKMVNRSHFEASFYKQPAVVEFVDSLIKDHGLKFKKDSEQYKDFCRQTLQMLYRLDRQKEQYKEQELYGEGRAIAPSISAISSANSRLQIKTVREVIDLYTDLKINIEKKWGQPRTQKGYIENLNRIAEMFEYISGSSKTPISEFDKESARKIKKILSIIPKNQKKKYPKMTLSQVIKRCEKGEIAKTKEDRLSSSTFNNYAILINGLFEYAKTEDFVTDNYFSNLKVPKKTDTPRNPFNDDELKRLFNTEIFAQKSFSEKESWKYWVILIALYTGARTEEICQLYLDDIDDFDGVLCFDIKERVDKKTGQKITSLKNQQSKRLIPVHSTLRSVGLLRYIDWLRKNDEYRLFPTLKNKNTKGEYDKANPPVSKWFNENSATRTSYKRQCDIEGKDKVLYCFRHTVETLLINHKDDIQNDKIDRLMGHQVQSTGRIHYGKYTPATILEVVEKIQYPNAKLPWDVNKKYSQIKFPW